MAIFRVDSTATGAGTGLNWTDAYTTLSAAVTAEAAGSTYYVDDGHAEAHSGTNLTIAFSTDKANPDWVISVDKADDSYSAGALINVTSNNILTMDGNVRMDGMTLQAGGGSVSSSILLRFALNSDEEQQYNNCTFYLNSASTSSYVGLITAGSADTGSKVTWNNCTYRQANAGNFFYFRDQYFIWNGGSIHASSAGGNTGGQFRTLSDLSLAKINDVDFDNFGTSWDIYNKVSGGFQIEMQRCHFATSWAGALSSDGVADMYSSDYIKLVNCGEEDINHGYNFASNAGEIDDQVDLYPSGTTGAVYNTAAIPYSFKMVSSANCGFAIHHLESPELIFYNESTTSQTITLEFIHNEAAALQDDEVWIQASYLGTSGSMKGTLITDDFSDLYGTANPLATPANIATSSIAWDGGLTERANSTVYVAGDFVKSSGSVGSAFICTVGGTSDSSVPAGFTSASDGDSITDNTVTWKAMRRQKCAVTITAAEQGVIKGKLVIANPSTTLWVANKLS